MSNLPSAETLIVEDTNRVRTVTINRPAVRNAVDADTITALGNAVRACDEHGPIRVVVITGTGGTFSSGADIQVAIQSGVTPADAHRLLTNAYAPALQAIRSCPWPVIAAVDGMAAGIACDMALACDIRLASERAAFAELFIRVGLIPDGGGTYLLPRLIGLGRALEMMFTGETITSKNALAIGLANKIYPVDSFYAEVRAYSEKLSQQAPLALIRGKRAMLAALNDTSYEQAMAREATYQREILESEDGFEGFLAFMEKRAPRWKGS